MKPLILDGCSKQGGAGYGYGLSGFDYIGFDIDPQPHYPGEFRQGDFLEVLADLVRLKRAGLPVTFEGRKVSAVHSSWPCQKHTLAQRIMKNEHPDLIGPGRILLQELGLPYVMENVKGSPLLDPVELCGCMFPSLNVYRERLFEFGFWPGIDQPAHRPHIEPLVKMGRPPKPGHRMHVVGNFSGVAEARKAMGIDWMTRDGLREAIPPAYTEKIGKSLGLWLAWADAPLAAMAA